MPNAADYKAMLEDGKKLEEVASKKVSELTGEDIGFVKEVADKMVHFSSSQLEASEGEEPEGENKPEGDLSDMEKDGIVIALEKELGE